MTVKSLSQTGSCIFERDRNGSRAFDPKGKSIIASINSLRATPKDRYWFYPGTALRRGMDM